MKPALTLCLIGALVTTAAMRSGMPELRPIDEAHQQPDFVAFREELRKTMADQDVAALLRIVHPDIKNSFGGNDGIEEFKRMWELDRPGSRIWDELREVLRLGGTFEEPDSFVAPYVFSRWPDGVDGFEHVAVIGSDVHIRSSPDAVASILATVSYAIVRLGGDRGYPQQPWTAVVLPDGREGFVASHLVRSPIDYRAFFVRLDGRWQMTIFLAGD